jgi:hypothetical protein
MDEPDPDPQSQRERTWTARLALALTLGVLAFSMRPIYRTGLVSDDAIDSLIVGVLRVEGMDIAEYTTRKVCASIKSARFFPVQMAQLCLLLYYVPNVPAYKTIVLAGVVLDAALLYALVCRAARARGPALTAVCFLVPLFQLRATFDPILSFYALLQVVVALLLASLIALERYLDGGRRAWLVASVALHLGVLLEYEVALPLFVLHAILIWTARTAWSNRIALTAPFAATSVACFLAFVALRAVYLPPASEYQLNADPGAFLGTLARQTSAGLPLSYFGSDQCGLFPSWRRPIEVARFAFAGGGLVVFAGMFAACRLGLRAGLTEPVAAGDRGLLRLGLLGAALAVLPAVLVSVSARHQKLIAFGVGYLPVYIQYFGVATAFAAACWAALRRLPARRGIRTAAAVSLAAAAAGMAAVNDRANGELADALTRTPDAADYNPTAGVVEAGYNSHRANLEAALHAGLLDDVPEHAVVQLAHEYPGWHNTPHSAYFYAMHSGKVVETVLSSKRWGMVCWFLHARDRPVATSPPDAPRYHLHDEVWANSNRAGCVVLERLDGPRASSEVRVFVRHKRLFTDGPRPGVVVTGRPREGDDSIPADFRAWDGRSLRIVRRGDDWGLFAFDAERAIEPGTWVVSVGNVSAGWGRAFYPPEVDEGSTFRWSRNDGVIHVVNASSSPRKAVVSMVLQNRGEGQLLLHGPAGDEAIVASNKAEYVRELMLQPGDNPIAIHSASLPFSVAGDPRTLSFRVYNFQVRDAGAASALAERPGGMTR